MIEDFNQAAFRVVKQATTHRKNPHAVALGRKGGKIGGRIRSERMSPEQRSEAARKAVQARWSRAKAKT